MTRGEYIFRNNLLTTLNIIDMAQYDHITKWLNGTSPKQSQAKQNKRKQNKNNKNPRQNKMNECMHAQHTSHITHTHRESV